MATQQQLTSRIKSVVGIEKITKAVQMEASAKLRKMEERLNRVRQFQQPMDKLWPDPPEDHKSDKNKDFLVLVVSADRGLCGSFNSSVAREAKRTIETAVQEGRTPKAVFLGNKGKQIMEREHRNKFVMAFTDLLKTKQPTFTQILRIADDIRGIEFEKGVVLYNGHKNVMTFDRRAVNIYPKERYLERVAEDLVKYDLEGPDDILENLYDFRLAVNLWYYFSETETAQTASRMTAMQNASKNTEDMLKSLRLEYNKSRQAKITTELCEIVSGASALENLNG
jgi:F-type H+-transporting ATPase subunit gamma